MVTNKIERAKKEDKFKRIDNIRIGLLSFIIIYWILATITKKLPLIIVSYFFIGMAFYILFIYFYFKKSWIPGGILVSGKNALVSALVQFIISLFLGIILFFAYGAWL